MERVNDWKTRESKANEEEEAEEGEEERKPRLVEEGKDCKGFFAAKDGPDERRGDEDEEAAAAEGEEDEDHRSAR